MYFEKMTNNRVILKSCQTLHSPEEKNNVTSYLSTDPAAIKPFHQQNILIKKKEKVLEFLTTRAWEMSLNEKLVPSGKITVKSEIFCEKTSVSSLLR